MERIESLHGAGQTITGVASGFKDLDERTAGFQPSDLVIVAARPAMGKTAFCLNVAQHAAIEHNTGVAIFSLEMSREGIVQRLLTSEARVDAHRLRSGTLRDADYKLLAGAAGILSSAPIWIDDSASLTPLELRSKARRIKAEQDIGLIMVDYLQLMREPEYSENRVQEISAISRALKALAKELHVPVIALSQLSRAPEQRGGEGRRPQLSDLRESGAIEQDADVVLFIYRAEMYAKPEERDEVSGQAEVIIGKQRNGPTGMVKLFFHNQYTRFDNYSAREPVESGDGA
jgi:replicative DNA helicase